MIFSGKQTALSPSNPNVIYFIILFHCHYFTKKALTISFVCLSMVFIFLIKIVFFILKFAFIGNYKCQTDHTPLCDLNSMYWWQSFSLLTNRNVNNFVCLFVCLLVYLFLNQTVTVRLNITTNKTKAKKVKNAWYWNISIMA